MKSWCVLLLGCLLGCRAHGDGAEENALRERFMEKEMRGRGGTGAWEISQQPAVRLGPEWGSLEPGFAKGRYTSAHRWMGQFGSVRLRADGSEDMVLRLRGVVPINRLQSPSAFHVRVAGVHLDTFYAKADEEKVEHELVIERATIEKFRSGPYLYLDIEATSPKWGERGYGGYAFAVQRISWKPASAPAEDSPDP